MLRPLYALPLLLPALFSCQSRNTAVDLDLASDMDPTAEPGVDFYRHANGAWLDRTEVPAERSSWSLGSEVDERNRDLLLGLLEDAAGDSRLADGSLRKKLGDFWFSGMDTKTIDVQGTLPLSVELDTIERIASPSDLSRVLGRLHAIGVGAGFGFGAEAGLQDPTHTMAWATQGGLGLPERDYYTREGEDAESLRRDYEAHVGRMLTLLGDADAAAHAAGIMALETRLAQSSLTQVVLRDPSNYDRLVSLDQARAEMPNFDWNAYLEACGAPEFRELNQPMPEFFATLNAMLVDVPLDDWKHYLRWQLVSAYAPYLSAAFEEENFAFFGTRLSGTPEMQARWKRVLSATNAALGEGLGQQYVEEAFSPRAKARVTEMVENITAVMRSRLETLDWMGEATRAEALAKLEGFGLKLGYPDAWRDWSGLTIKRSSYAGNMLRANRFAHAFDMAKIGQPIDPTEWGMNPQTLNAYYHPLRNEIVFPAAILQPPFFSEYADDPLNYGAIGAVIGHEITHGFDDSGSRFDAEGRLRNWWTDEDRAEFESRTAKLVAQYGGYEALPGLNVNGELTLGENIADLGGVSIAFEAMQRANEGKPDPMLEGYTREQRFFLAFGRIWRKKIRDEALRLQINTDPHSPAEFRVKGPLANLQSFADAFALPVGSPMLLPAEDRALIW